MPFFVQDTLLTHPMGGTSVPLRGRGCDLPRALAHAAEASLPNGGIPLESSSRARDRQLRQGPGGPIPGGGVSLLPRRSHLRSSRNFHPKGIRNAWQVISHLSAQHGLLLYLQDWYIGTLRTPPCAPLYFPPRYFLVQQSFGSPSSGLKQNPTFSLIFSRVASLPGGSDTPNHRKPAPRLARPSCCWPRISRAEHTLSSGGSAFALFSFQPFPSRVWHLAKRPGVVRSVGFFP